MMWYHISYHLHEIKISILFFHDAREKIISNPIVFINCSGYCHDISMYCTVHVEHQSCPVVTAILLLIWVGKNYSAIKKGKTQLPNTNPIRNQIKSKTDLANNRAAGIAMILTRYMHFKTYDRSFTAH